MTPLIVTVCEPLVTKMAVLDQLGAVLTDTWVPEVKATMVTDSPAPVIVQPTIAEVKMLLVAVTVVLDELAVPEAVAGVLLMVQPTIADVKMPVVAVTVVLDELAVPVTGVELTG